MSLGVMESCFSISSTTPRPPVWMQTCSNASLKSGMYALILRFSTCSGLDLVRMTLPDVELI